MKGRIFVVVVLVVAAAFAGRWVTRSRRSTEMSNREETRQSFRLGAGARVEVRGINGSVEVNTSADADTADVLIVRTATSADDLEYAKVYVEETPSGIVVRGENNGGRNFWRWLFGGGGQVKQEVTLTVPRRVELSTKGVNGPVEVGEVDGSVSVEGVNGRVEVAQSLGHAEIKGVNGGVRVGVSQLGSEGMDIKGVNGNVEIRLKENIDADINVKGHNGNLSLDVPNVTMQEREGHSNAHARLGAGGAQIEIKGVNGNVRFTSSAPASTTTTTTTTVAPVIKTIIVAPGNTTPVAPVPPVPPTR